MDDTTKDESVQEEVNEEFLEDESVLIAGNQFIEEKQEEEEEDVAYIDRLVDLVPNKTMHDRLRYRLTSKLSETAATCMKALNIRGLDYYQYLMIMLKHIVTSGSGKEKKQKKKKTKKKLSTSLGTIVFDRDTSADSSSEAEEESKDPIRTCFEKIQKDNPELIENLRRKEEKRKEMDLLNSEKLKSALNAFYAQYKSKEKDEDERMCFLEKKSIPKKAEKVPLDEFIQREGFPVTYSKTVPPEIFEKLGIDQETFDQELSFMDEDDLMKFYDDIFNKRKKIEDEEDNDIIERRGRFRFRYPWQKKDEVEEEGSVDPAYWEREYWRTHEEDEGIQAKKLEEEKKKEEERKRKEDEMEMCQLMLVRSGTSWKQELGYMEGWKDTPQLGKQGQMDMEEVARKVKKRGYKFDYVLVSSLGRSMASADIILSGSGQEDMIRRICWELNPRHLGKLEGETELGCASRYGWLPQEWFVFTSPPPIAARDIPPRNLATADPNIPETLPPCESVFHVQERTESVWIFLQHHFIKKGKKYICPVTTGKRTILVCAHRDSIEAILLHAHGFGPTDFTVWHPSYTSPIILMYYKHGNELIPAFIDFLCDAEEAERHNHNLSVCWLQRFVDIGLLNDETYAKLIEKIKKKEEIPDIEELWDERVSKTINEFEQNAEKLGQQVRQMNTWLDSGHAVTPDGRCKINNDNTVFKEYVEHLQTIENARDPLSDVLSLEEQIVWVVNRDIMPLEKKVENLKMLWDMMLDDTKEETKQMLKKFIEHYEKLLEEKNKLLQDRLDARTKKPEEKFKDKPPQLWADLVTLDDWEWAARNKKLPGGVKIPRKLIFDDWNEDSVEEDIRDEQVEEGQVEVMDEKSATESQVIS